MSELATYYAQMNQPFGPAEQAFGTAQDHASHPQNTFATLIQNIDHDNIVDSKDAFADLIVPKRTFLERYGLHTFLAFNESDESSTDVLQGMLDLAIQEHGAQNNSLFLNVLPKAVRPHDIKEDELYYALMSVAYVHLWSVQTSAMKRKDQHFLEDGTKKPHTPFRDAQLLDHVRNVFPSLTIEHITTDAFAPVDIRVRYQNSAKDAHQKATHPIELFKAARAILRVFETNDPYRPYIERGSRIMARHTADNGWNLHILTGGALSPLSQNDTD